jgi:hypothetical protein
MTIYPVGHRVRRNESGSPRAGTQTGTLTQPWGRNGDYPRVLWDGESEAHKELPECVEPLGQATSSVRDAWMEAAK